jgi:arabinosaccharide transport system permease protein
VSSTYTILTILVLIPLPIILAVFVNRKKTIFKNFFRSSMFVPALTSVIFAGLFFRYSFGEQSTTLVNSIIGQLGISPVNWLQSKSTAMFVLVIYCTWRWFGVNLIYFLTGLQNVPPEIYESASIDGANTIQKFKNITLPFLKPVIIYVITISIYGGYSMFAESFNLWNGPRSPGDIGLTIVNYLYQQGFSQNELGFGSAIGMSLFAIVMVVNIIQLKAMGFFRKESN